MVVSLSSAAAGKDFSPGHSSFKTGTGFACVGALRCAATREAVRDPSTSFALLTSLRMTYWGPLFIGVICGTGH